jgi:hypothetical protein
VIRAIGRRLIVVAWADSWDRGNSSSSTDASVFTLLLLAIPLAIEVLIGGMLVYYGSLGSSPPKWSGVIIGSFVGLVGPGIVAVVWHATRDREMTWPRRIRTAELFGLAFGVPVVIAVVAFIAMASGV